MKRDLILVNSRVFAASLKALNALIEDTQRNYDQIRKSNIEKNTKYALLRMLGDQITGMNKIADGFENCSVASSDEGGLLN